MKSQIHPPIGILLFVVALCAAGRVEASFTPTQCALCPTMTYSWDWSFVVADPIWELPTDPNCDPGSGGPCPHYTNYLDYTRYVTGNQYVKQFGFNVASFQTEPGYDYLDYGQDGGTLTRLTGSPSLGWRDYSVSGSLQSTRGKFRFYTDVSVTNQGFVLDAARVCCQSTPQTGTTYLTPAQRISGILLGTNDTVYLRAPGNSLQHQAIVLWGGGGAGADFDVYVRCNALPTETAFDYYGIWSGTQEIVHMPAGGCSPGTWYVAVNSFYGYGYFSIVSHVHYPAQHRSIRAGTNFAASSGQMSQFQTALAVAAKHFYGAADGTQYLAQIDLYNSNNCGNCGGYSCDLCFINSPGTGNSPVCGSGRANIYQDYWFDPEGIAHEWGHKYFCAGDEYYVSGGSNFWQCGHSNMSYPWGTQNNFCYGGTWGPDHRRDKTPGAIETTLPSAWTQSNTAGAAGWVPSSTPDNYDYRDFDFHGSVGRVILH